MWRRIEPNLPRRAQLNGLTPVGPCGEQGSHAENGLRELGALARRHLGLVLGPPGSYVSSIHVADGMCRRCALHAAAGTFNIVDDQPLTKREYADAMARAAGAAMWLRAPAGPPGSSTAGLPR